MGVNIICNDLCAQEGDVGGGAATGRRATSPGS